MSEHQTYAEVILPIPVQTSFTYLVPSELSEDIGIGVRVLVPFGKRKLYSGIVGRISNEKPEFRDIKDIDTVLDSGPIVSEIQIRFWKWISEYYMCTLGEVYRAALPTGLKLESETRFMLVEGGGEGQLLSPDEASLIKRFRDEGNISVHDFQKDRESRLLIKSIHSLMARGILKTAEKIRQAYKPRMESMIKLSADFQDGEKLNEFMDTLARAPRQYSIIENLVMLFGEDSDLSGEVKKSALSRMEGSSPAAMSTLLKKGVLEEFKVETGRLKEDGRAVQSPNELSPSQDNALNEIRNIRKTQNVILLEGVTSSGKTEIYIHLISEELRKNRQVLYLLPEIALTAQIIERLKDVFGGKVGIFHSRYGDSERVETFLRSCKPGSEDEYQLILGARSSLFLPFRDLGLVIIDEEHENTYKQSDPAPRYHTRDSAIVLARMYQATVILGSATPSYESHFNARSARFGHVKLPERFRKMEAPEIIIADLKEAYRKKRMVSLFTPELFELMQQNLSDGKQLILFQNRRGFSPYIECFSCGWIPRCAHCDVSLTYHKQIHQMVCHYCGYSERVPGSCPECNETSLVTRGFGTEKLEDEVAILFPDYPVSRMDTDTTRTRRRYEKIIDEFASGKSRILIGTQIVTKGLDFDNVGLVGVMNADNLLNFPDFRSFERSFQLMLQVAGRSGRKDKRGKVVIQTSNPGHPVIRMLHESDYHSMYLSQMEERKAFNYPPYYRLLKITMKHKDREILENASKDLANRLKTSLEEQVLGPQQPLVAWTHNWHLMNLMIKLPRTGETGKTKLRIKEEIESLKSGRKYGNLIITPDVDPM
jgi:primosomal protein N' (replication factor Y) (superfamily II helicase)